MSFEPRYTRAHHPALAEKVEALVAADPVTGCWNWTRAVNADGYGYGLYHGGNQIRAHRVAFLVSMGGLPPPDNPIRHLCSNPRCCRPNHLAVGTFLENAQDTKAAGRANGSRKSFRQRKADALAIRMADGPHSTIAKQLGVSLSTVGRAKRGATWRGLQGSQVRRSGTKLTESDVRAIRESDEANKVIAARYGVTAPNILAIRQWRTWRHVA